MPFKLFFKNTGKTPARDVAVDNIWEVLDDGRARIVDKTSEHKTLVLFPDITTSCELSHMFSQAEAERIAARMAILSASGTVSYSDIFGVSHWSKYCVQYEPSGGFSPCVRGGNEVDRDAPDGGAAQ